MKYILLFCLLIGTSLSFKFQDEEVVSKSAEVGDELKVIGEVEKLQNNEDDAVNFGEGEKLTQQSENREPRKIEQGKGQKYIF